MQKLFGARNSLTGLAALFSFCPVRNEHTRRQAENIVDASLNAPITKTKQRRFGYNGERW
jgi:hypothetical protein